MVCIKDKKFSTLRLEINKEKKPLFNDFLWMRDRIINFFFHGDNLFFWNEIWWLLTQQEFGIYMGNRLCDSVLVFYYICGYIGKLCVLQSFILLEIKVWNFEMCLTGADKEWFAVMLAIMADVRKFIPYVIFKRKTFTK